MSAFIRTVLVLWYREGLLYFRDKLQIAFSVLFPLVLLVIFGQGLSETMQFRGVEMPEGFRYIHFFFPGVLVGTTLFVCMFYAVSVVDDRNYGSLRAILTSPVSRVAVALGKVLGGATDALFGSAIGILLLPLVGVSLSPKFALLLPFIFLIGIAFSAFGVFWASVLKSRRAVDKGVLFLTIVMFLASGALIPVKHSPSVIEIISKLNPATYGVDLIRQVYFRIIGKEDLIEQFGKAYIKELEKLIKKQKRRKRNRLTEP